MEDIGLKFIGAVVTGLAATIITAIKGIKFVNVRYGNVLNSNGSIIPILHTMRKDPKYKERLQELQKSGSGSWDRSKYIEKGGWDKMPGRKETTSDVAEACAEGLIALIKK